MSMISVCDIMLIGRTMVLYEGQLTKQEKLMFVKYDTYIHSRL